MRSKSIALKLLTLAALLSVGALLQAGVITGNFCSQAPVDNPGDGGFENEPVGRLTGANQWFNDLTSSTNFTSGNYSSNDWSTGANAATPGDYQENLYYTNQTAAPDTLRIDWSAEQYDTHNRRTDDGSTTDIDNRHEQLFGGFLSSIGTDSVISLSSTNIGLAYSTYDLYLYVDGEDPTAGSDNNISTWSAHLSLDGGSTYVEEFYGLDNSDFIDNNNSYNQVTGTSAAGRTAGNYVVFENITSDFYVELRDDGGPGVVLNGFEIVPEPSSFALLALLGGVGGLMRRRRSS